MSVCPRTGITVPECSCVHCLTKQVRQFQPGLLAADPIGEIRVSRGDRAGKDGARHRRAAL